ncbi:MAG: hypothetical protein IT546_15110 [Caulobacteraceae bacterium]|nr:hypothetical protein [Caulobacteraceae bacterium]
MWFGRILLFLAPFAGYFVWREFSRRRGREHGAPPWAWLTAAGALFFGVSLLVTGLTRPDTRDQVYVPAEVGPDGRVSEGHFEPKKAP